MGLEIFNSDGIFDDVYIFGGGDSPSSVTLHVAAGYSPNAIIELSGYGRNRMIGNMTLDGDERIARGVHGIGNMVEVRASNLIIRDVTAEAIYIENVMRMVSIQNNTIVDCGAGILIDAVLRADTEENRTDSHETFMLADRRAYQASALENNLVVNCEDYAIKIGSGNTAAAWNPFSDAFISLGETGGNPITPVQNNMVHNCGANPMQGDIWYRSNATGATRYGPFVNGVRQVMVGGQVVAEEYLASDGEFEDESTGFVNGANSDYRLAPDCRAIGAGSSYRLDIFPGTETSGDPLVMRRSIGAHPSHTQDDYALMSALP